MRIVKAYKHWTIHTPRKVFQRAAVIGVAIVAIGAAGMSISLARGSLPLLFRASLSTASGMALFALSFWSMELQFHPEQGVLILVRDKKKPPEPSVAFSISIDLSQAPLDILSAIFSHLDLPSLKNAALTSQPWYRAALRVPRYFKPLAARKLFSNTQPEKSKSPLDQAFLDTKVVHCGGKRLARIDQGTTCIMDDGTIFSSPMLSVTAVSLYGRDIFIGTASGELFQYTLTGNLVQDWNIFAMVTKICVDDNYVIAMCGPLKHFRIFNRHDATDDPVIRHSGKLQSDAFCIYRGALFFLYEDALQRLNLDDTTYAKYPMPKKCLGILLGVWHRVVFFNASDTIYLVHYPSSSIINTLPGHHFYAGAVEEHDSHIALHGFAFDHIQTFTWSFHDRAPAPKLTGTFVPVQKEQSAADLETPSICYLWKLPSDVLLAILHLLTRRDLSRAARTCRDLWCLSKHDAFWTGHLGLHPSTYPLYSGSYFKAEVKIVSKEHTTPLFNVYTSPYSEHIAYSTPSPKLLTLGFETEDTLRELGPGKWGFVALQVGATMLCEAAMTPIKELKYSRTVSLCGDLIGYVGPSAELVLHNLNGKPAAISSRWKISQLCFDKEYLYAATTCGQVLRYLPDGTLSKSLKLTDKAIECLHADPKKILYVTSGETSLRCTQILHRDFEPLHTGTAIFDEKKPSEWYLSEKAFFYQHPDSPAYAWLFQASRAQKIQAYWPVHFLHTQGDVVLMKENAHLVLANYRTGERLNSIPIGGDFSAQLRGSEIFAVSGKKSMTITWQ